jgi:cell shape-determining protein MreC
MESTVTMSLKEVEKLKLTISNLQKENEELKSIVKEAEVLTKSNVEWKELRPDNLPKQGSWILITDGTDWRRVYVTNQFEFVEAPHDRMVYSQGITHWSEVVLP